MRNLESPYDCEMQECDKYEDPWIIVKTPNNIPFKISEGTAFCDYIEDFLDDKGYMGDLSRYIYEKFIQHSKPIPRFYAQLMLSRLNVKQSLKEALGAIN